MNKLVLLVALVLLSGCYTPQAYQIELDLNDLKVLQKQGKLETKLIDATVPRPIGAAFYGPPVKIYLSESIRIFFIPDDKQAGEMGIEPEDVPFDPYQPPEWNEDDE